MLAAISPPAQKQLAENAFAAAVMQVRRRINQDSFTARTTRNSSSMFEGCLLEPKSKILTRVNLFVFLSDWPLARLTSARYVVCTRHRVRRKQ